MKKTLLLLLSVLGFTNVVEAQKLQREGGENKSFSNQLTAKQFGPNGFVRCVSTEYNRSRQANGQAPSDAAFEAWLAPKIQELKNRRAANPNEIQAVITIPVVVHVIHNGDAYGTGENITDEQVLSQIQVLNEDYRKMAGTPGDGAGVDVEIQFCMAQVDPSGNPTDGIDRVNLGTASWDNAGAEGTLKPNTFWNPDDYLNMWTCRFGGDLNGVLGYAQFPNNSGLAGLGANNGGASTDGVIMAFNAFGSSDIYPAGSYAAPYDKGRTTTHEVGHWLGLRHIWGDGACGTDDFCADTPESDAANGGCPTGHISCGTVDQIENYMDYTNDTCMNIFTQDQKDRMVTVMGVSDRRVSLASSTKCSPAAPYIQFDSDTGSINENTNCSYTDYTFPITIAMAPSADATITFNVTGGTATQGNDYVIVTNPVVFPSGATGDQNLTLRVYDDGKIEGDETVIVQMSLSTGGDALLGSIDTMTINISDDDMTPSASSSTQIFYEDFEDVTGWTIIDNDGDGNNWGIFADQGWTPHQYSGAWAGSFSWDSVALTPDNFITSPAISVTSGTSAALSLIIGSGDDATYFAEHYSVYVTTDITDVAAITSGTVFDSDRTIPANGTELRTYDISAYMGQTIYVSVRHHNVSDEFILGLDDVTVTVDNQTTIEEDDNSASPDQVQLNGSGTTVFYDNTTSDIMLGVNVTDASDYGCTSVSVSRDQATVGAAAAQYGASAAAIDFAMAKEFTIAPTTVVGAGTSTITFYFTEAEVAAWEAYTGNVRGDLYVVKNNGSEEIQPCSVGAFGSEVTLTASFATGIDGTYTFARQQSLPTANFELTGVTLYPNPNNGVFNLGLNATSGNVTVDVFDVRGRLILNKSISGNGMVNETINLQDAQSGIYLVNIQDGSRKVTKKIIVE